jgi:hypothetical protein
MRGYPCASDIQSAGICAHQEPLGDGSCFEGQVAEEVLVGVQYGDGCVWEKYMPSAFSPVQCLPRL